MKSLILLSALISVQAFAGTIICNLKADGTTDRNIQTAEDADQPDVIDFLRVEGLIDAEGFLTVRRGVDTMATFKSKRDGTKLCQGVNVSEDAATIGGSPKTGWRKAQLDSKAFKIRLYRDPVTKEIQATTYTDSARLTLRNCDFIEEDGDQEALKALWDETHDPELEEQAQRDQEAAAKRLRENYLRKAEQFLGIAPGSRASSLPPIEADAVR